MTPRPTPPQIFEEFESQRITREQLHAALRWHHLDLIDEVVEAHENPLATFWEGLLAKRAAARWSGRHGHWRIRHIFHALSHVPDFPPAQGLWNALHPDVPLHCFFRLRRAPVFRLLKVQVRHGLIEVHVEHGSKADGFQREAFHLTHLQDRLAVTARGPAG